MKRFDDLTEIQKSLAVRGALKDIINGLMMGTVDIKLSREMHQKVMENMLNEGRKTGDFTRFHNFVKKVGLFKDEVDGMARAAAKTAYYTEPREYVIYGVAEETLSGW